MDRLFIGRGLCLFALFAQTQGCAHTPEPYRIRYADLGRQIANYDARSPLVVEFQAGDRIPVNFAFTGEDFELAPARPALEFVAKRHCFVRFSQDGVRVSEDGVHFDEKPRRPGSFRFGLGAQRGEQPRLDVAIAMPQR